MLVNDRKEYNNSYVGISPQFQPIGMPVKSPKGLVDGACIKQTLQYPIEGKPDSNFYSIKLDTHYLRKQCWGVFSPLF